MLYFISLLLSFVLFKDFGSMFPQFKLRLWFL
jgi:hypothetical protein